MKNPLHSLFGRFSSSRVGVLDIGDQFVKYVALERKEDMHVLDAGIEEVDIFALHRTKEIIEQILGRPSFSHVPIVCSFPPVVYRADISIVHITRKKKGSIEGMEESSIVKQMIEEASKSVCDRLAEQTGIARENFQEVHVVPLRFIVDGYEVKHLRKIQGVNIEGVFLCTFFLSSHFRLLSQIREITGRSRCFMLHETQALHEFAKTRQESRIVIDIGEYSSLLAVTTPSGLSCVGFVREGGMGATYALEKEFGLRENTARELKMRYMRGELSEEARSRIRSTIAPHVHQMVVSWRDELERMGLSLPLNVSLMGGESLMPEIQEEILEKGAFDSLPLAGPSASVSVIVPKDLGVSAAFPRKLDPIFTPPILLAYAFSRANKSY
ncbi:MAG: hypothetical protein Q8P70_02165 [bacterium]|nr:hypothetical protein [bacterium]